MSSKYILGIDQSTQGTKALLFDEAGSLIARSDKAHRQIINELNYVEHDPQEIMANTLAVVRDVVEAAGIDKNDLAVVGLSNQRETALAWDRDSGEPIYNAIVWQCARGQAICDGIEQQGHAQRISQITGLNLSPFFSAPKLAWIMQNCPDATQLASQGRLCMGNIDSWLIYNLTDEHAFCTDVSNASRTMLMDLEKLTWSDEMCALFGIEPNSLPRICSSDTLFGMTDFGGWLEHKIPIHSAMGDSHAALYGQGCHMPGMIKATYGTGSSIMLNVGDKICRCDGIVSSVGWGADGKVSYVLEGNINYTGAVITWLKDDLGLISSPKETGPLAMQANPGDTTYIVPAFSGLGAPWWDGEAKAVICGITRTTGKKEIVRAAEDCIAHQIADVVEVMAENSGIEIAELRVDGGPTRDKYLMQFQSDIINRAVQVASIEELSGLGAAYMAGIAQGIMDAQVVFARMERTAYTPHMDNKTRAEKRSGWVGAVKTVLTK